MTAWNAALCETNQINLNFTRTGGNKPPLILLHGLTGNGACWTPVACALEEKYDVIMPDARGHGKSSAPGDGYLYEDHAKDIEGLIESLQLSSLPILIGHSMGGMSAAMIAYRQQKRLAGLILADPTFLEPSVQHDVYKSDVAQQHQQCLKQSLEDLLTEAKSRQPHRSLDLLKRIIKARHQTSINAFQVLTPPNPEFRQLVGKIDVQTLLVIAETGIVSLAVAEELQRLNPRIHLEQIAAAGHGLHYDQPEQFISIITSFLNRQNTKEG